MQLILVSGLSGSGKSIALHVLEDAGYYCVDNLPATLLLEVADFMTVSGQEKAAISVDARSAALASLPAHIEALKGRGVDCRVLYLEASTPTLLRRFSETRRKHPLLGTDLSLPEAIEHERSLLASVAAPPMTYTVNGKQYVAVYAGGNGIAAGSGSVKVRYGSDLYTFALPS